MLLQTVDLADHLPTTWGDVHRLDQVLAEDPSAPWAVLASDLGPADLPAVLAAAGLCRTVGAELPTILWPRLTDAPGPNRLLTPAEVALIRLAALRRSDEAAVAVAAVEACATNRELADLDSGDLTIGPEGAVLDLAGSRDTHARSRQLPGWARSAAAALADKPAARHLLVATTSEDPDKRASAVGMELLSILRSAIGWLDTTAPALRRTVAGHAFQDAGFDAAHDLFGHKNPDRTVKLLGLEQ